MQGLILKQEQEILLVPGDQVGAGSEPMEIRFSLIDFAATNRIESNIPEYIERPAIRKLQLTPGETMLLAPGEKITALSEPIKICFGMPDFTAAGRSSQEQLLSSVVKCLLCAIPSAWRIEAVKYNRRHAEQIDQPIVNVIANAIAWKRTSKGRQYREHVIDVLLIGRLETERTVWLLDQWAELFLDGGGPLEHACMSATPFDIAEAGYSVEISRK